ncbi:hypothetical protein ABZ649_04655 [Streptomyces albidoflavus]|uniref:hypothetical protein n=1 Tax=Streptomyces albidoflavus TaxID=1886 RepID=UPI0033D87CD0
MATITKSMQVDVAGVLMGPGTPYRIADIRGFGTPERRAQSTPLPTEDGVLPGVDLYGSRTVTMEVGIRAPGDAGAAMDGLAALHRAASNSAVRRQAGALDVLRVRWPGRSGTRRLYGRLGVVEEATLAQALYGWVPITVEFNATDPSWHGEPEQQLTLPLDISQDRQGFKAPLVAPITTGISTPDTRLGWVNNEGDLPAWPSLRITGPVANPKVWVVETGRTLQFNITLGVGEYLDVQTRPGTRWVLRNGTGSVATALTNVSRLDRFVVPPGRSEIRWTATDYTNTSKIALKWRDAYTAL